MKSDQASRITRLYVVALALIAALSIAGQVLVQTQIDQQRADAKVINIAGRQRMLSQRICKCVLLLNSSAAHDVEQLEIVRGELKQTLRIWRQSHEGLQHGDAELGLPGALSQASVKLLRRIDESYRQLYDVSAYLSNTSPTTAERSKALAEILDAEASFLTGMDAVVNQLELEAKDRVEHLRIMEMVLLVCTLLALAAEGVFVFRPAVRRIRESFEALESAGRELLAAKDAAEAADRAKTQFLAGVSHELRTPLHAVRGAAEILLDRESDPKDREYLQIIDESAESLSVLVEDLLDLSQIEIDGLVLSTETFDLHTTLSRAARLISADANAMGLSLDVDVDSEVPPFVVADEYRLQQVVVNLLSNAIKFTQKGGIRLSASTVDDITRPVGVDLRTSVMVRIEVADTGIGIPADRQEAIFDKFTQLETGSHRRSGGVGLGLAIAAQLVAKMHGKLRVRSEPGRGSTFWFDIPLPIALGMVRASTPIERIDVGVSTLIADDTEHSRIVLKAMLESLGHRVSAVDDGESAFELSKQGSFDLIILDMQMPRWNGERAAAAIRDYRRRLDITQVPIVLLSADAARLDRSLDPFDACLIKPVSKKALAMTLAGLISRSAMTPKVRAFEPSEAALERLGGDRRLYDDLLRAFFEQLPAQLDQLRNAAANDAAAAAVVSHRLRGQLATFDFNDATEAAERLEAAAKEGVALEESLVQLESCLKDLSALQLTNAPS